MLLSVFIFSFEDDEAVDSGITVTVDDDLENIVLVNNFINWSDPILLLEPRVNRKPMSLHLKF